MNPENVLKCAANVTLLKENEKLLQPASLWKWFLRVTEIPRGSGHVEQIANEIMEIAKKMGLEGRKDQTGNVCVSIPASPGLEEAPKAIVQCHMDMVVAHDPKVRPDFCAEKDGVIAELRGDDGFLYAKGTSLGGDDGIGIATCLALMENVPFKHCGIDCLFTVDEETSMDGASAVRPELLSKGVKYLINVDSEDDGMLCLGSAGGEDLILRGKPERVATNAEKDVAISVTVSGFAGGHTGCEIDKYRANALKILCTLLHTAGKDVDARISKLDGGQYNNAIANKAAAVIVLPRDKLEQYRKGLVDLFEVYREDYSEIEDKDKLKLVVEESAVPATSLTAKYSVSVMQFWILVPCMPLRMSPSIKGFVETSCAWSVARLDENGFEFKGLARTSRESSWNMLESNATALAAIVNGELEMSGRFPGWLPEPESTLAKVSVAAHERVAKKPPVVYSVHAGLECGIIMGSVPGLEAISIGPLVQSPHSTAERVGISTVPVYFDWVCEILRLLSEDGEKNLAH